MARNFRCATLARSVHEHSLRAARPRASGVWLPLAVVFVALQVLAFPTARAEDDPPEEGRPFQRAPDPATHPGRDAELFAKGVALQAEGRWIPARRAFWKLLDEHPDSPYAAEAEDRSGANAFLGVRPMGEIGPSERRIDVALMGDGYLIGKQDRYDKHCQGQLDVLLKEQLYRVYRPYFNFWQFNLASAEKGVDEPEPAVADEELEERRRRRGRTPRKAKQYSTALDCKAAGPQGQVWANPQRVAHYLQYLPEHDSLAIVFAQMGQLGMGGMGIATTGPRGVVVHEFGHAFVGLLDEYANNPGEPTGFVSGPNATTSPERPPWQHFLDARVKEIGVFEGGATFQKGVWRPAASCAMNASAGSPYCPVCLEQGVLRIYERVSPIDRAWPELREIVLAAGAAEDARTFRVQPMEPDGHRLAVKWILGPAPPVTPPAEGDAEPVGPGEEHLDPFEARLRRLQAKKRLDEGRDAPAAPRAPIGMRAGMLMRGRGTAHDPLPAGTEVRARRRQLPELGAVVEVTLPATLARGRHLLTAIVWDPARPQASRRPWVLKDERGLLEDRVQWTVEIR